MRKRDEAPRVRIEELPQAELERSAEDAGQTKGGIIGIGACPPRPVRR